MNNLLVNKKNHSSAKFWMGVLGFWCLVFLINTGPHWEIYSSTRELIETVGLVTVLQFLVAYVVIALLIPHLLDKGRRVLFLISVIGVVVIAAEINIAVRYLYLETTYADSYQRFLELYGDKSMRQRMFSLWTLKYLFFTKLPLFIYPGIILIAYGFHHQQKDILKLSEQKNRAELNALKNQLNPHFIFNTLNNLYALAIKKSDQTPLVIEKLSDILDYILYRCTGRFVSLNKEVELINNYISLEKIRYGERLSMDIRCDIQADVTIAPLLLLTLLENACKHSISDELHTSEIRVEIKSTKEKIEVTVANSKPKQLVYQSPSKEGIGLDNMRKQLQLLYPSSHHLSIQEDEKKYQVKLLIQL